MRAAVWLVEEGQTRVMNLGKAEAWDGQSKESLLTGADKTLSQASEGIKPEPNGVIFGLQESWIEKDAIGAEKKTLIKHLCNELALKPLGFVVTDTAIIAYLKAEEGTPLSAILIQLNSGDLNLTLVKVGKISGSQLVGRSDDLGADIEEGLSRFEKVDALPPRIIIYNGKGDFEEEKQQLLSYDWESKLPFIHFPKVESLDSEVTVRAVALAGGSEVAQSLGLEIKPQEAKETARADVTAVSLGFVVNEDAALKPAKEDKKEEEKKPEETAPEPPKKPTKKQIKINFQPLFTKLGRLAGRLPSSRLPLLFGGIFAAILIILVWLYWSVPKASVVLYLDPQTVNQKIELTLDQEATNVSPEDGILPVKSIEKSVSGEKTVVPTGEKLVGDPAKGAVTLYNKTASTKTFAADTSLLSPDGLVFVLDEETTVASRSAVEDGEGTITITPGKAEAKITAANIGPESNLPADTRLSFKQFSEDDYYGKSGGLSGGTAEKVKAVTAEDREELEADLTADLIEQAKTDLMQSLGSDQKLIEQPAQLKLDDKKFSAAAGEAAESLTLTGQLVYKGLVYRQTDLDLLLQSAIKTKVPENMVISEFSGLEMGKIEAMKLSIDYQTKLLPRLDLAAIKIRLKGRYPEKVEDYLVTLPQFVGADIKISPNLPKGLKTLPRLAKNINLEIKPAQ